MCKRLHVSLSVYFAGVCVAYLLTVPQVQQGVKSSDVNTSVLCCLCICG